MRDTRKLVFMAMFVALQIALTKIIAFMPSNVSRISLTFLTYAFAGNMFGPLFGASTAVVGDLIGHVLFPQGPYILGMTISALLAGALYGYTNWKPSRMAMIVLIDTIIINGILNTIWLKDAFKSLFMPLLVQRTPGLVTNFILKTLVIGALVIRFKKGTFYENRYSNSTGHKN